MQSGKSAYGPNSLAKSFAYNQSQNIQVKSIGTCGVWKMTEDGKLKKKQLLDKQKSEALIGFLEP